MASGTRQFSALMRKNFISWKRQPKCSFFEICCPAFVMFLMVLIRNLIDVEVTDFSTLTEVRQPTFPAFPYTGDIDLTGNDNTWDISSVFDVNSDVSDFLKYASYPSEDYWADPTTVQYDQTSDTKSPAYFIPSQCLKVNSFQLPRVTMPIIAVVGEWNKATQMMQSYLKTLIKLQNLYSTKMGVDSTYPDFQFRNFTSKEELYSYTSADNYTFTDGNEGVCYGFQISKTGDAWTTELYFNDQQALGGPNSIGIPNTQKPAYNPIQTSPDTDGMRDYLSRGYETLHNLAANVVLKLELADKNAKISLLTMPMPPTNDKVDDFADVITGVLPLLLLLIFIPPVYNTVFLIVREKESRIKESMRMMGMNDTSYWLSWYVYYTCVTTVIVFLSWAVLLINVIVYSNSFLILVFMLLYAQSVFAQILFISMFFESSKYSNIVGALIYFAFNLLGIPVQSATSSPIAKIVLSLIPQVAMSQICIVFGNFEGSGVGLNFSNAAETIGNYTYLTGIVMLIISGIVWTLFAFYLDKVLPRQYGEKLPACFCFKKKYYSCCNGGNQDEFDEVFNSDELQRRTSLRDSRGGPVADLFELKYLKKENYEPVPPEVARLELDNQCLKIQDLTKVYENGFQAVNGINLKMYNGQIFALLGHNGAGKSTTISMLTGLLTKSTGQARIFENDLFNQMSQVRNYMGVCPQHDVLFDTLTPEEHLDIFYDFKGGDPARKEEEICSLIVDVSLAPDRHKQAGSLSGGNRRKLSVAIALCGNSRLVMLDEPTAGMDLSARRSLWDMLKNYRNNRIIILTTHYMDEADVLGDRIGIMAKGKIRCLGSSLFLKNRFGAGYKLTMVKKFKVPNKKIQPYLQEVFGQVEKLSEVSQEITFKIDYDQAAQFAAFFTEFDQRMEELDILSYGISMTTLEEVFLKVNAEGEEGKEETKEDGSFLNQEPRESRGSSINKKNDSEARKLLSEEKENESFGDRPLDKKDEVGTSENLVGNGNLWDSVKALLTKRFNIYKRDKCGLVCEVVVPVILVFFGLCLLQISVLKNSAAFTLDTSAYPGPQRVLFNNDLISSSTADISPQTLAQNLPDYSSYFEATYDKTSTSYQQFYNSVNETQFVGETEPFRFGSYQVYKAVSDDTTQEHNFQVNVFVNATSQASSPYFSQYMYQSIFKTVTPNIQFNVVTAPFPVFYVFESRVASGQALDFASLVSIALALIPCVIISFIIKEREQQLKHMQMISGVSLPAYWMSNMMSDIVKTYIPVIIILILQYVFSLNYEGVWLLLLLYPIAIVPFTYVTSFGFQSDTVAQIITLFVHFMVGGILPIVIFVLQNIPSTANLGDSMRWWFTFIPTFCVGEGIIFSSTYKLLNISRIGLQFAGYDVNSVNTDVLAMTNLGGNYVIMIVTAIVFTGLLVVIEADIFQSCSNFTFHALPLPRHDLDLDDDVIAEQQRLALQSLGRGEQARDGSNAPLLDPESQTKGASEMDVIRVFNFRKLYTTMFSCPFLAVENISFGLDYGECFALLGVNGAGKSTTFKSLTRDIVATAGEISIAGHSVTREFSEARKLIGYCPQHDAIFALMTVLEHLWFYARIKGIPNNRIEEVVEDAIKQLNLADHRDKPAGTLSGGNKRKLSVGIAIIGNPPIILLDEPSAGMDPEARRFMWSVVEKISQRDKKSAVILTTHSMEEAEALSTKMGIMVRGGIFRCYGSSQHIKNKFATGYELEIKIRKATYEELNELKTTLQLQGELNTKVNLQEAKAAMENTDIEGLILDQIRKGGVGSDLVVEAGVNAGEVRLSALVQFIFTQSNGFKFIKTLAQIFEQVELLEQCGDFYKVRVPREDKTIGYLFGQIEQHKADMKIQEYSVAQTSLEQIFQNFAHQSVDDKAAFTFKMNALDQLMLLNPDRKSTMLQKRMSIVGRKSENTSRDIAGGPKITEEEYDGPLLRGK